MAKLSYDALDDEVLNPQTSQNGGDVGFFTLRNDGDEAIVRFMCDSTDEFDILTVHDIKIGEKFRKVNCIRDPREPVDNCPLCASGTRINNRFFIRLVQYDKVNDNGTVKIVPKAMIWERATSYAKTLKSYLDNYGPLSDVICKIIRHGKAGDMQTTYEIVPNLSKNVYPDEVYIKDTTLFGTYDVCGTIVMNKNAEELVHFVATGTFPEVANATNNGSANTTTAKNDDPVVTMPEITPRVQPTAAAPKVEGVSSSQFSTQKKPWETAGTASTGFERPRRY